jgi:1,5-anhydro-D-fructose reductase (1,5-anhydro-D-mannitol-forming)
VSADRPVGWAFVGAGRHAHLWLGPALAGAKNAAAVGVWSRDPAHAADFAAEFGIARTYTALQQLLADPDIEAVVVSTPNSLHASHALAALQAGKHVLVEKPMATCIEDAQALVRAARETDRRLGVGFHLRHNVLVQAAQQRVARGAIGILQYVSAQFNLVSSPPPRVAIPHANWKRDAEQMGGAGALMGLGVHLIDLVRYLVGQEVIGVSAVATWATAESPLESFAQVLLEFPEAQTHLVYGGSFPLSRNDVVLYGSSGRLTLDGVVDVLSGGALEVALPDGAGGQRLERWAPAVPDHYRAEIEAFGEALRSDAPFAADGVDGLRAVEVASAVIAAQRSGQRVPVQPGLP